MRAVLTGLTEEVLEVLEDTEDMSEEDQEELAAEAAYDRFLDRFYGGSL